MVLPGSFRCLPRIANSVVNNRQSSFLNRANNILLGGKFNVDSPSSSFAVQRLSVASSHILALGSKTNAAPLNSSCISSSIESFGRPFALHLPPVTQNIESILPYFRRTLSTQVQLKPKTDAEQSKGEPITFLTLSNLSDNPGAITPKRRVGRGIGSSKGKTCGRGHKGQKSRAGRGVHPTFEGGQTKFYKRLPKKGRMKNSKFKLSLVPLNVGKVQDYVTMGRLIPERSDGVLTMRDFVSAGIFPSSSIKSGVKLLGGGKESVKDKLFLEVPWASASAIEAIESKGGYVTTVHSNRLALRALLKPHKFPAKPQIILDREAEENGGEIPTDIHDLRMLPRRARPPPKYMQYYTDYNKRGYLNPRVQLERKKLGLKEVI